MQRILWSELSFPLSDESVNGGLGVSWSLFFLPEVSFCLIVLHVDAYFKLQWNINQNKEKSLNHSVSVVSYFSPSAQDLVQASFRRYLDFFHSVLEWPRPNQRRNFLWLVFISNCYWHHSQFRLLFRSHSPGRHPFWEIMEARKCETGHK